MNAKEKILYYNIITKTVLSDSSIVIDQYCNAITVVNCGTTQATFNGLPLAPPIAPATMGESMSIPGNKGELFEGRIDIAFPGTGAGDIRVIQKVYLEALCKTPKVEL